MRRATNTLLVVRPWCSPQAEAYAPEAWWLLAGRCRVPARATIGPMRCQSESTVLLTSSSGGVMPQGRRWPRRDLPRGAEGRRRPCRIRASRSNTRRSSAPTCVRRTSPGAHELGRAAMSRCDERQWIRGVLRSHHVGGRQQQTRLNFWACMLLGVAMGIVFQLFSYALTRGRRDFTSISQVVARATRSLPLVRFAGLPGLTVAERSLSRGGEAQRRSQGSRRAREGRLPGRRPFFAS